MPAGDVGFLFTCEHGGKRIPRRWAALFRPHRALLNSHRGWDPGALGLARRLAKTFDAPLIESQTSRLLVDLNRSEHHRALFSPITHVLPRDERDRILDEHYRPYRDQVVAAADALIGVGRRIVHVSSHSFVPELDGEVRSADIGLLYDPRRALEAALCDAWAAALTAELPEVSVRRNYPYRGNADGLTTSLRRRYRADVYLGIEIELNQRLLVRPRLYRQVCSAVGATLVGIARS